MEDSHRYYCRISRERVDKQVSILVLMEDSHRFFGMGFQDFRDFYVSILVLMEDSHRYNPHYWDRRMGIPFQSLF